MIKFFRHIRQTLVAQNKVGKYLLYAVGEIILVVLGILIALQINNQNEARKARQVERSVMQNLVQNLESDSTSYSQNYTTLEEINRLHKSLYEIGINNKSDTRIEKPNYIRRLLYYNPITKENDPFVASKVTNEKIKSEILDYFRQLRNMDETYSEFEVVIKEGIRVYLGKNEVQNLSGWFENLDKDAGDDFERFYDNFISSEDLGKISKSGEFQQLLLEASIKAVESTLILEKVIDQNRLLLRSLRIELAR